MAITSFDSLKESIGLSNAFDPSTWPATLDTGLNVYVVQDADVVSNYNWTVSNKFLAKKECPTIIMTEYQQTEASMINAINFAVKQYGQFKDTDTADGYKGLYVADPTGNTYTLPFYNPYNHVINNSWGSNVGSIGNWVNEKIIPALKKTLMPSAGIERAKNWEGTAPSSFSFSFQLLNTVDPINDMKRNGALKRTLIYNNLLDRYNVIGIKPPVMYDINIPGVRRSPAAVITNLRIENIGQINNINGENIPDAWEFTIELLELVTESRQIFAGATGGKVVTSITKTNESESAQLSNEAKTAIGM